MSWSRGSDSFTHPVTKSVTNRIVRNPPPGSDPDWDSSSWTREVSELDRGWDSFSWTPEVSELDRDSALSWSRGSDSFTHPVTKSVTNRIVRNPPPGSDPDWDSSSWTREVSGLDRGWDSSSWEVSELDRDSALSWLRGSDSFTHPVTKSVTNRIVRNPPPCSEPGWDSSSWTREVSELDRGWDSSSWEVSELDRDSALSWSRGSDSFTHPVTKSVTNRIVRNPPPGSDPDWDSSSRTREVSGLDRGWDSSSWEVSELDRGWDSSSWTPEVRELDPDWDSSYWTREVSQLDRDPALGWSRGSDSFTHPVTNSVTNRIVRNPPPGSDPEWYSSSWTREVSELDRDPAQRWSRGSDSFTHPVTNSVTNRIVRNPPPYSDHDGDSSSWTREVSQLFTWDESDSVSQFRRDPAITLSKWLENFLIDSSIIVLEEKKEVVREVLREERERREERGRGAKVGRVERWMNHYSSFQKILLVGEGDFSFSACLAVAFGCAHNIIATSLDSREFLTGNYMNAMSNIESLTSRGAKVMHGVDATQMANHFVFDGMTFDRIVFNFPHGGFFRDESRETQLRRQRNLVRLFMKNAKKMIDKRGEIHVSHKSNSFFLEWNLEQLATNEGLRLIESLHFTFTDYPGYHTKYGFGGDKNFNCNPSKTYKFGLQN